MKPLTTRHHFVMKSLKKDLRSKTYLLIIALCILFFLPSPVYSSTNFYYIHVGSSKTVKNAERFAQELGKMGLKSVIRGEDIANKGFWYRIYVGPLSSRLEAQTKSRELLKKGVTDYAAVKKKQGLLSSNIGKGPKPADKVLKTTPEKMVSPGLPATGGPAPVITPRKTPPIDQTPHGTKQPSDYVAADKKRAEAQERPRTAIYQKPKRARARSFKRTIGRGLGRNLRRGGLALGITQIYRDIQTDLTKRERTTSDGTTTTIQDLTISDEERDDFPTLLHMTLLRLRVGVTDYLEVFADSGATYTESLDIGFAYGGGIRIDLFDIRGFYGAVQGEYLGGDLKEEYRSDSGNKWEKETDWQEFLGRIELGIVRSRFSFFLGGSYLIYDEDTIRKQLENLPFGLTLYRFNDELENEDDLGIYGGMSIYLTSKLFMNLEGQALNQESVLLSLDYLF